MMEVNKRKVYSLFVVVFFMGLLVALDLPTSLSSPDDFAVYSAEALIQWLKGTVFGEMPTTSSLLSLLYQIVSLVDFVLFILFLGSIGIAAEVISEHLGIGFLPSLSLTLLFLFFLFFAGFLAVHPKLIPCSVVLAAIPFLFLRRALEAKH